MLNYLKVHVKSEFECLCISKYNGSLGTTEIYQKVLKLFWVISRTYCTNLKPLGGPVPPDWQLMARVVCGLPPTGARWSFAQPTSVISRHSFLFFNRPASRWLCRLSKHTESCFRRLCWLETQRQAHLDCVGQLDLTVLAFCFQVLHSLDTGVFLRRHTNVLFLLRGLALVLRSWSLYLLANCHQMAHLLQRWQLQRSPYPVFLSHVLSLPLSV